MSNKVKLTVVIEDADVKIPVLILGFLSELGYSLVTKKTHGSPGKLVFSFKKKKK